MITLKNQLGSLAKSQPSVDFLFRHRTVQSNNLRLLHFSRYESEDTTSGSTSAQKGHSLVLERSAGERLTTREGAVADAGHAVREEALPARLLLLAVVDAAAAQLGRAVVALVCTRGVARAVQLPLTHLNPPLPAHSWQLAREKTLVKERREGLEALRPARTH